MGNLCGKEQSSTPASTPGRVLGSAPAKQRSSAVPQKVGGPARTLGSDSPQSSQAAPDHHDEDARKRAAEAAEARAKGAGRGKLQNQLSAQKKQSRSETLRLASAAERRARDADDAAQTRNWQ